MSQLYLILIWIKFSSIWESSKGWISTKRSRTRMIEINSTLFALNFNLMTNANGFLSFISPSFSNYPKRNFTRTKTSPRQPLISPPDRFQTEHKPPHPLISIFKRPLNHRWKRFHLRFFWNFANRRLKPKHFITFLDVCRRFKFDILTIELTPW